MIRVLMIGDVVGECGCDALSRHLWQLKKIKGADLVVVNGENSAKGNGITVASAQAIFAAGADVITTGNHVWRRREIYRYLDDARYVIRPANFPPACPGMGYTVFTVKNTRIAVMNLLGQVFLDALDNPFTCAARLVETLAGQADLILGDFHAEATSEKKALAVYLDGRVQAVVGTHTHVQTADAKILPGGCAFITDLGMTGADDAILGVRGEEVIRRFLTRMPARFEEAWSDPILCGVCITLDETQKRAAAIEAIRIEG